MQIRLGHGPGKMAETAPYKISIFLFHSLLKSGRRADWSSPAAFRILNETGRLDFCNALFLTCDVFMAFPFATIDSGCLGFRCEGCGPSNRFIFPVNIPHV